MTTPAGTRSVTLRVSHDDGTTWQSARVSRNADGTYPAAVARTGHTSLRVTAEGSAATVTVLRALPPLAGPDVSRRAAGPATAGR